MRMSPYRLSGNVPIGAGHEASCTSRGDIDDESQRTGPNENSGGRESQRAEPGASGRADGDGLPAGQASGVAIKMKVMPAWSIGYVAKLDCGASRRRCG